MSTLKRKTGPNGANSDAKKPKQNGTLASFFTAPPKNTGQAQPAAPKFNKEKWVAGLTQEQRTLLKLEIDTMDDSWLSILKEDLVTKEFMNLKMFLEKEEKSGKKIFPPKEDIYSWYVTYLTYTMGQGIHHANTSSYPLGPATPPSTPSRSSS